jgi:MFS family permease
MAGWPAADGDLPEQDQLGDLVTMPAVAGTGGRSGVDIGQARAAAATTPVASPARDWVRLLAVTLGALALCAVYVWRGDFSSDFWEHAAVVRELSVRPFSPRHPLLSVNATHAYFSPYLLAVALVARATGISATTALATAGLVNIVLLVLAFRRFLVRLLPQGEAAAPYALLFIFFLWGNNPWMWSGFLHIGMLGYNVSYPSTFAAAAMFLSLSLLLDALDRGRSLAFIGIAFLLALCVITHPPTAVVLLAGLAALFLARVNDRFLINGGLLLAAVVAGVAAALAWPYFPLGQLLVAQPVEFNMWSLVFYQGVPAQVWPAILALPVLAWRLRGSRRDALVLFVAALSVIYALGGITGDYGLGRVIAYIVVLVQIALGAAVATWESRLPARRAWLAPACTVMAILGLLAYTRPPLPRLRRYERPLWYDVGSILTPVRPGEVVLADSRTSYMVPVLTGGRVVAWRHPIYWVPDHAERREAQERFFAAATDSERRAVIGRYHVQWILLNRREVQLSPGAEERLLALGCIVAKHGPLVLLDVRRSCSASGPSTSPYDAGAIWQQAKAVLGASS